MLLEQFSDLLVLMLVAAAIMSMALEDYAEGAIIILIVILNATLGVYQVLFYFAPPDILIKWY
jgi:Ca2+-transporting ATPase